MAGKEQSIGLYDLRYALHYDENDPVQICRVWDHCHAVSTLQGIANRSGPNLYVLYWTFGDPHEPSRPVPDGNIDLYWLDKYRQPGQWLSGRSIVEYGGIVELVEAYRGSIGGAVVYDPEVPATSNVATTVAGVKDLIPVRYDTSPGSLYETLILQGPRLPVRIWLIEPDGRSKFTGKGQIPDIGRPSTGSAKCDAYLWMKHKYMDTGLCSGSFGAYFLDFGMAKDPDSYLGRHYPFGPNKENPSFDFIVGRKGFFFDLSPWQDEPATDDPAQAPGTDFNTLCELLFSAYEHGGKENMIYIVAFVPFAWKYSNHMRLASPGAIKGRHQPVSTEWEYTRVISAYNGFMDTGEGVVNASFWAHFPLDEEHPQKWVTHRELQERGYLNEEGTINFDGRDFVLVYIGDYDTAAISQWVPFFWDHPDRGTVPLAWAINPILALRAPMALHYMWKTATPRDFFISGNNGAGYLNPGMLQEPRPISGLPSGLDAWAKHCTRHYRRWGLSVTGFVIDGLAPGLNEAGLDCYASFSPNGIVPMRGPMTFLHKDMPVLRCQCDICCESAEEAVQYILEHTARRPMPFHWFRTIFRSPQWYRNVYEGVRAANPKVQILDAPTFFELYRIYLKTNQDAAGGKIEDAADPFQAAYRRLLSEENRS